MQFFNLRPFQKEAVQALESHDHVVLTAPTGSGKSLIFQEYILRNPEMRTLLITPLNALSRQHTENLQQMNDNPMNVRFKTGPLTGPGVWIASPEQVHADAKMKQWSPQFLVVDEAHCIWEWGADFRPDFKYVLKAMDDWKIKKSFWCTATLPHLARQELLQSLSSIAPPNKIIQLGKFEVPRTLLINVHRVTVPQRVSVLHHYCSERADQLGIIFFPTRQQTEKLGVYFQQWKIPFFIYHAGMSTEERMAMESKIRATQKGVILATSAFGMGMDIPQIRYTVFFRPPFTILSMMQGFGRATRSEEVAEGVVFWHEDDFNGYGWLIKNSAQRRKELEIVMAWCKSKENKRTLIENYFNSR